MTNEELKDKLYSRMNAEMEELEAELLQKPPQVILDRSYEYLSKKNIISVIECGSEFSNEQLRAMLRMKAPLDELYVEWRDTDCSEYGMIRNVIKEYSQEEADRHKQRQKESREDR